jgi:hypothetical protein
VSSEPLAGLLEAVPGDDPGPLAALQGGREALADGRPHRPCAGGRPMR